MAFLNSKVRSEDGAETIEIIIGIVVFVVFGIAVFGMITNVAGNKMEDTSKCIGDSQNIITRSANTDAAWNTCAHHYYHGDYAGFMAHYNGPREEPELME